MARYTKQATFNYWVHVGPRVQALLDEGHSIRLWEHPAEGLLANLKDLPVPREDVKETVGESSCTKR